MKTVMVFGTFDIVHPGHRSLFKQAKRYGDRLIAVVARDATVQIVKGKRPLHSEAVRRAEVAAEPDVDLAVLGDVVDRMKIIRTHRPDVICLGYDQHTFVDELVKNFPNIQTVRLESFHPDIYKSSKFKQ